MIDTRKAVEALKENIAKVVVGKDDVAELMLCALLCKGHVLIEDVPGVGKTTLVSALAKSLDCSFKRIQFTPDITPSDVTGFTMINMKTGDTEFHVGAVMSQIVLADEINRTSPKTQSSLLEVMEEGQVTVDGVTYQMPHPFIVLATQNPLDFVGTYPLPEAQLDRFFMKIAIGYPTPEEETDILERFTGSTKPMESLKPICSAADIESMQEMVTQVFSAKEIRTYLSLIAQASRKHPSLQLGISTRGIIALLKAAQARALINGRNYVIPEDVQQMAAPVLCHRIMPTPEARMKGLTAEKILSQLIASVKVPVRNA